MSLRWKLFRFLAVETFVSPPPTASAEVDVPLLVSSLTPTHVERTNDREGILRRFASAADRTHSSDAHADLFAFALPRGQVQVFDLAALKEASASDPAPAPVQYSIAAHDSVVVSVRFARSQTAFPSLVTLGIDSKETVTVKVWAFRLSTPSGGSALGISSLRSQEGDPRVPSDDERFFTVATYRLQVDTKPTTLSLLKVQEPCLPDVSSPGVIPQAAVGFSDGCVVILSGDLARENSVRKTVAPAPGEMSEARSVVFLQYCHDLLYAVTERSVVAIIPVRTEDGTLTFRREVLDNLGVLRGSLCCVLENTDVFSSKQQNALVVAKEEALYFFTREGRAPCLAFPTEVNRGFVAGMGNYLVHSSGQGSVTAYDVVNKLIAFRGKGNVSCAFQTFEAGVRGTLLCLSRGSVLKLTEISLEDRVGMLLKRGLYLPAVQLARTERTGRGSDVSGMLTKALRQYSEYLMSKNRFEEAAEQLIETIGTGVEPSWVISQLVEQSGLRSGLRLYLEALHASGMAAFVHTKVLITCYRHDRARGAILGSKATEKTTDEHVINVFSDVNWTEGQVDAAIKLCRDAKLFQVAEIVARRRGRHVQLASTLVEDLDDAPRALDLLKSLSDKDARRVLHACGRKVLERHAHAFVVYLADAVARSSVAHAQGIAGLEPPLSVNEFLPIFIDMPRWRASFLQRILSQPGGILPGETGKAWILLFESLVIVDISDLVMTDGPISLSDAPQTPQKDAKDAGPVTDYIGVEPAGRKASRGAKIGRRALKILQSRWSVIDLRMALEIAEQQGHDGCLEYLYEHLRMYKELGALLRTSENGPSLLRACRRHGDRESALWIEAIRFFAPLAAREEFWRDRDRTSPPRGTYSEGLEDANSNLTRRSRDRRDLSMGANSESGEGDEDSIRSSSGGTTTVDGGSERANAQDVLDEAMHALERSGSLSAAEVLEKVTVACPEAAWGVVRDFFERVCATQRREAATVEQAGRQLEVEIDDLRRESTRLGEETVVITARTCASCADTLNVPAVHFFCEHSYHAGCLAPGGGESLSSLDRAGLMEERQGVWAEECPKCAPELDGMVSMRQALQEKNERHDDFFRALKGPRDGLSAVIDFLQRSPFI